MKQKQKKQEQKERQFKSGDLIETIFGNHLGIVLGDEPDKFQEWYIVHLFHQNNEQYLSANRMRKVS
jgi:hypothetical protein